MKQDFYEILSNEKIAPSVFKMVLSGDTSPITAPGQFVNIKIPELYLRRPISICDRDDRTLTVIYKVVGAGTEALSRMKNGEKLDLLISLGNGFDTEPSGTRPILIGGGVGAVCVCVFRRNRAQGIRYAFEHGAHVDRRGPDMLIVGNVLVAVFRVRLL